MNLSTIIKCDAMSSVTSTIKARRYRIDLDKPIEPQMATIYPDFKEALNNYIEVVKAFPGADVLYHKASQITKYQSADWHSEVEMIARIANIAKEWMIIANISYEMQCTSIVVKNSDNKIFMGRNLDFIGANQMAHLSLEYAYYKDGKLLYIAATQFGNIGILNAVVPGKFTISINQRDDAAGIETKLLRISLGHYDPTRYLRKVMEQCESYQNALEMLQKGNIASAAYYIVTGTKDFEGAVIARDYDRPVLVSHLGYAENNDWFIVQTNFDRNYPDPAWDHRRVPVENRLKHFGHSITYQNIFDLFMSKEPSFNSRTIYTTIQSAEDGYFNTTIYYRDW